MSRLTESTLTGKIAKYLVEEEHKPKAKFCPRCGAKMSGYPAVSRFDNETEICSDCGVSEAMLSYTGAKCGDPHRYDPNTGKKLKECNTKDIKESANKEELEKRIGELRQAIVDGVSEDEKKEMEKEIAELEGQLNECGSSKTLKEDSYDEPFFQEIEDALINAGFNVDRYSDVGMLTKNLGWVVSNSEGEVQLTCSGTYIDESAEPVNESVTVVTGDGSSVNTTNTASVSTDDNCTVVNTGDTTVTICNDPAETSPVEPIEDVTDIQASAEDLEPIEGETEVSDETIEEVPTEEPVEDIEVADEEKNESVIVEDKEDEIPAEDAEGPEEPIDEIPTEVPAEDEVGEEPAEDDYETVNVTSLTVLKNQGDVYVLQTKNADGSESYYVCRNYNAETQEADEPQKFDTKEEADSAYFELVGVSEE